MVQRSNFDLMLCLQVLLLSYDLFVNSSAELLRMAPIFLLVFFITQDTAILFNIIIIFLLFFNTVVFQYGLVNPVFCNISLHVRVMNLHWKNSNCFVWTEGLQTLFVFQRIARQLYCYFYKWTVVRPGDSRFYQDSLTWERKKQALSGGA
uniref:Transmembrane protein 138 n=1 Tax=Ursus americanus TaxID=9643 RepID=A0A452QGY4_URSAM